MNRELQEKLCVLYADSIITGQLLRKECKVHGFLAQGRLRVLRLESLNGGKCVAYGEHVSYNQALGVLAEDIARGGIPYNKMYKVSAGGGLRPQYYSGLYMSEPGMDSIIRRGNSFDAFSALGKIMVKINRYGETQCGRGYTLSEAVEACLESNL